METLIEIDAAGLPPLGMPAERFLHEFWQRRPLLVRNAFPAFAASGFEPPITPEDLAGLACEETALSRLIRHDRAGDAWSVRSGPFDEGEFPGLGDRDWTLLVQDVDKWDADVAALLPAFAFLPRWRIDDIMVSFAAPGGSVGAHVDQYDVFLLQAQGHRRWQIDAGGSPPLAFRDDVELKLLRTFAPTHDWLLGPGDMLYLPPGVPHHGVAEDACLTFSVGMRAPSVAELIGDYADSLAEAIDESERYADAGRAPAADAYEIDADAMARAVTALDAMRATDPDAMGDWFGRFVTRYRSAAAGGAGGTARSRIQVEWDLQQGSVLHRNPWSRVAWRRAGAGARLYVDGRGFGMPLADAPRLAAATAIDQPLYAAMSSEGRDCVMALHDEGLYRFEDEDGDAA